MPRISAHFTSEELSCSHCGDLGPWALQPNLDRLETLRSHYGKPMPITSAYRCPGHPIEAAKDEPGEHSRLAIDVQVFGFDAVELTAAAYKVGGWTGIGWSLKSGTRFVHLDRGEPRPRAPRMHAWTY